MQPVLCWKEPTIMRAKSKFTKQLSTIFSENPLKHFIYNGIITIQRESTHSKVDAPSLGQRMSLRTPPILWVRQDRHFYFRLLFLEELFSLSRKASNATIKLPKDISNANIPMKIEMISKAVIGATSLPTYYVRFVLPARRFA